MLVYWFIFIWTMLAGRFFPASSRYRLPGTDVPYISRRRTLLIFLPLIFFAAFRTNCIDTASYIAGFESAPAKIEDFSEYVYSRKDSNLYHGLLVLFKCYVSDEPTAWLGTIAVIQGTLVANFFRKYSCKFSMSVYIFMASTLFTWMFNGMRQFLAVTILLACTDWMLQKKWWKYIPMVMLVSGFEPLFSMLNLGRPPWYLCGIHQSALMMIPVYFLAQGRAFNWKVWVLIVLLAWMSLTGTLGNAIEAAAENTVYANDMKYIKADTGSNALRVLVALVPVAMAWYAIRSGQVTTLSPTIHLCTNLSFVSAALYGVASLTSGIYVGRLPIYCEMYSLVLLPWLIEHAYRDNRLFFKRALYGCYLFYFIFQMYFSWDGLTYGSSVLGIYLWGGTG